MNTKSTYKTKQREELIEYLKLRCGEHITVNEICNYFKGIGKNIGMTTVYRHLERMVDEGLVSKYIIDGNSPACFEYMGDVDVHTSDGHDTCFHCKCEVCGKLYHVHCKELDGISDHLYEHHSFRLNPLRTVFYGVCNTCA